MTPDCRTIDIATGSRWAGLGERGIFECTSNRIWRGWLRATCKVAEMFVQNKGGFAETYTLWNEKRTAPAPPGARLFSALLAKRGSEISKKR